MDVGVFMRGVKDDFRRPFGVLAVNLGILRVLREWTPAAGSLFIEGEVGTGKTTLAAALVRGLVVSDGASFGERSDEQMTSRYGSGWRNQSDHMIATKRRIRVDALSYETTYCDEYELMRREELSWKLDPVPLAQLSQAPVLVLDDLGKKKAREVVVEAIEKLIAFRYAGIVDDAGKPVDLPMVITSNVPWHEITAERGARYGARVADRLREMVPHANRLRLRGPSWREPPEPARPRPRGRRIGKDAAGDQGASP